tara:strand:- start:3505 stop:3990 length:486 start_codon:yes stop_codon:yes gene_type:complete
MSEEIAAKVYAYPETVQGTNVINRFRQDREQGYSVIVFSEIELDLLEAQMATKGLGEHVNGLVTLPMLKRKYGLNGGTLNDPESFETLFKFLYDCRDVHRLHSFAHNCGGVLRTVNEANMSSADQGYDGFENLYLLDQSYQGDQMILPAGFIKVGDILQVE